MADPTEVRAQVLETLENVGGDAFRSTLGDAYFGCRLEFPESCWQEARAAGFADFRTLVGVFLVDDLFEVLGDLVLSVHLLGIRFSSLYRPTGLPPHVSGRGVDLIGVSDTALDREGLLWVDLRYATNPAEPALGTTVREALSSHPDVTQVLGPWWMWSRGRGVSCNEGRTPLELLHRTHLHFTVSG